MSDVRSVQAAMFFGLLIFISALLPAALFANEPPIVIIRIEGVEDEMLQNALAFIRLERLKDKPEFTVQQLHSLHDSASGEIIESLQPFGYFQATVDASLLENDKSWLARYLVDPGPLTRVGELDVRLEGDGAEEPELLQAIDEFPLRKGDGMDSEIYEKGRQQLLSRAMETGYPQARISKRQVAVNAKTNLAAIKLVVDTGTRYSFGEIRLHQDVLDPSLATRFVDIETGTLYSQPRLLTMQQDLIKSGYFSVVDVNPLFKEAEKGLVPIDVQTTPANRQRYTFGLGYDSDIGLNGSTRWKHRYLNKQGHQVNALVELSQKRSIGQVSYWIPVRDPRNNHLLATARFEHDDTDTSISDSFDLRAGYHFRWHELKSQLFAEMLHEDFDTGGQQQTSTNLFSLGSHFEYRYLDNSSFPRKGYYGYLDLSAAPGPLSNTSYLRSHLKGNLFYPVGARGRLNLRGELGWADMDDFEKYPSSLRFYAGGTQSVRGYEYKTLGPKDEIGEVIGGKNVVAASLEYDHQIVEKWVGALFFDAGNAFNDSMETVYQGAGVGLRWISPIGSVRVDLAFPLNDNAPDSDKYYIHFGFGAEF